MRPLVRNLASVVTIMLCSCATEGQDELATETSTQMSTETPAATTSTTSTTTTETAEQTPVSSQSTTTQSTSTTSTPTTDQSATGSAAPAAQSSTTTTTTSTAQGAEAVDQASATTPATAADVKKGASVYDKNGDLVGTIDSVTGQSAVVSTGKVKATVEMSGFGKNDKGLVILMTKAEIEAAASAQKPK